MHRLQHLLCLLLAPFLVAAAAPPAKPVARIAPLPSVGPSPITPDCRWLFVVDTSAAMQRQADGLYRTTHRLVATGLGGRMQEGDIFTIWTYADTVLTREFPLNAWTPELNIALANRAYEFLARQKFRGKSNLRPVFAELSQALAIATNLTIVLISDGTDVIVGTPFDRPINVTYGKRASETRAAKMPFITSLVTRAGEFSHWSVRAGLEDVGLPFQEKPVPITAAIPPPAPTLTAPKPVVPTNPPPMAAAAPPPKPSPPAPAPVGTPNIAPKPAAPPAATNGVITKPSEPTAPKPAPAPVPLSPPAPVPKATTNAVALTPPVSTPTVTIPSPTLPPKPETKTAPVSPPKPTVATPQPAPPAPKPIAILPPVTNAPPPVVAQALPPPPPPPPVIPPALRQPKSAFEPSNTLAKIELLRPPTGQSAPPAKPLEARVIEPKPAPPAVTNPVAAKPMPPPATNTPVAKPVTSPPVMTAPPKVIPAPVPLPPAPAPKPAETKVLVTNVSAALPKASARTNSPTVSVTPSPNLAKVGEQSAATKPPAANAAKPAPAEGKQPAGSVAPKPTRPTGPLAVATPSQRGGWIYLAAAVGLLLVAGGIITHLLRPRPHPSAISQSLDDKRL